MSILLQVLRDLAGMFLADARLSLSVLALVGLVAALIAAGVLPPLSAGWLLLAGSVLLLLVSVGLAARK
jgi:hypothetical protein